jgi:hypothetical protein
VYLIVWISLHKITSSFQLVSLPPLKTLAEQVVGMLGKHLGNHGSRPPLRSTGNKNTGELKPNRMRAPPLSAMEDTWRPPRVVEKLDW